MIGASRAALVAAMLALAPSCVRPVDSSRRSPPQDPFPGNEADDLGRLRRELEAEILDGYSRAEMVDPEAWIGVADPLLGLVCIGTGPDDFLWTRNPQSATGRRRWPLGDGWARTKMLDVHVTEDGSVAWASDEVSWRLDACGRTAVVPLRLTALYLRDGERWVPVMEHISYAQPVTALLERGALGAALTGRIAPPSAGVEVAATVERALTVRKDSPERATLFATTGDALVLWPDPAHELRGTAVVTGPTLADAFDASVTIEGYRVGVAGGAGGSAASVAWWAGTLLVKARRIDGAAGESTVDLRLRATVVIVRDGELWRVVQAHVSAPVTDADLAAAVYGAARAGDGTIRCEGPLPAPAMQPEPAPTEPAAPAVAPTTAARTSTPTPAPASRGADAPTPPVTRPAPRATRTP